MKGRVFSLTLILLSFLFLWGCGGEEGAGGDAAPPSSTITINPTALTVTYTGSDWLRQDFQIFVKDSRGNPINNAKVTISYPVAIPAWSSCIQMYNGSASVYSPFDAFTGENGVYTLRFDYTGGCAHEANLEAVSGSAVGSASIDVN